MNKLQTKVGQNTAWFSTKKINSRSRCFPTVLHLGPLRKLSNETFVQLLCSRGYATSATMRIQQYHPNQFIFYEFHCVMHCIVWNKQKLLKIRKKVQIMIFSDRFASGQIRSCLQMLLEGMRHVCNCRNLTQSPKPINSLWISLYHTCSHRTTSNYQNFAQREVGEV